MAAVRERELSRKKDKLLCVKFGRPLAPAPSVNLTRGSHLFCLINNGTRVDCGGSSPQPCYFRVIRDEREERKTGKERKSKTNFSLTDHRRITRAPKLINIRQVKRHVACLKIINKRSRGRRRRPEETHRDERSGFIRDRVRRAPSGNEEDRDLIARARISAGVLCHSNCVTSRDAAVQTAVCAHCRASESYTRQKRGKWRRERLRVRDRSPSSSLPSSPVGADLSANLNAVRPARKPS